MEVMKYNETDANALVISALMENSDIYGTLNITSSISSNNISYELSEETFYHGKLTKRITSLKKMEYINLLKFALRKKGYDVTFIKPIFRKNRLSYEIYFHLLEKDEEMARKRKKI